MTCVSKGNDIQQGRTSRPAQQDAQRRREKTENLQNQANAQLFVQL